MSKTTGLFRTDSELIEKHKDYEREWLLEGGIVKNGINIIGAERGSGKTRFMLSLASAIAFGQSDFLGYKLINFGCVLYMNFEISEPEFVKMYEPIKNHFINDLGTSDRKYELRFFSYREHRNTPLIELGYDIIAFNPAVIIVDSYKAFSHVFMKQRNISKLDNDSLNDMYGLFYQWQQRCKAAIVLINHTNKGTSDKPSHSDLMYGAGTLVDLADMTLIMRKTRFNAQVMIVPDKSRYAKEGFLGTNVLSIKSDHDINPSKLWFELVEKNVSESDFAVVPIEGKKTEYSSELKEKVIALHSSGKSLRQIEDETGVSKSTVSNWIKRNS